MNVYDFDGTIYDGDSSRDFYFYILKKHPKVLKYIFYQVKGIGSYFFNCIDKTCAKEHFFSFLQGLSEAEIKSSLDEFWDLNENKIMEWYKERHQEDDVVISASPDFLLRPVCKYLGIDRLIASNVNMCTGKFEGPNCYGVEKVVRFKAEYPNISIGEFYSDSISDAPLKELAQNGFLVKKNKISEWPENCKR